MDNLKIRRGNDAAAAVKKHVRTYITVFAALAVLTVVTVAASYLGLSSGEAFFLALTIASIKGTLVAGFFMHLFTEKTAIIAILGITVFLFMIVLFFPFLAAVDQALS
ncbi:MAG: cytochrome C oxidase subunit IV family protein [Candidatus Neomarinimicrobiota bacterium]